MIAVMLPAVAMLRDMGDVPILVQALSLLGFVFYAQAKMDEQAHEFFAEADRLVPGLLTSKLKAWSLVSLGLYHLAMGEKVAGTAQCETGLAMQRAAGNERGEFKSLLYMAEILHRNGCTEKAVMFATRAVVKLRQAGLKRELGSDKFDVVALSLDRNGADRARKFLKDTKVDALALYNDPTARLGTALKAAGMPTTILIDKEGREIGRLTGPAEWDSEDARKLISAHLN